MLCSEVMKKNVECIKQSDTAQSAAQRMRDKNIGFVPVCDDSSSRAVDSGRCRAGRPSRFACPGGLSDEARDHRR